MGIEDPARQEASGETLRRDSGPQGPQENSLLTDDLERIKREIRIARAKNQKALEGLERVSTGRSWGTIQPDKRYSIGHVDMAFTVPSDMPIEQFRIIAAQKVQKGIADHERLSHWKHYDRIPIKLYLSPILPSQLDAADLIRTPEEILKKRPDGKAVRSISSPASAMLVHVVARVYFIRELTWVNLDELEEYRSQMITRENGFVPFEEMPDGWREARQAAGDADRPSPEESSPGVLELGELS